MFVCPYYANFNPLLRSPESASYVRILHASPNAPEVDIYINNRPSFRNVTYRKFTDYVALQTGLYNIRVFPKGATANPIINTNLFVPAGVIYTVAVTGNLPNINLFTIVDVRRPIIEGKTFIRFIHLSPDSPKVDITLPNGTVLFKGIGYKGVTKYIPVNPGEYTIEVKVSGSNKKVLSVPKIRLKPNRFYSAYAVGYTTKSPNLQLLLPLDGNTYLKFIS